MPTGARVDGSRARLYGPAQSAAGASPCRSAAAAAAHPFRCLRGNDTGDQHTKRVADHLDRLADAKPSSRLEHVCDMRRNVPRWLPAGPSVPPKVWCDHPVIGQCVLGKGPKRPP
jgi:hypothetical protein